MTHKDYALIAEAIRNAENNKASVIAGLADALEADNPRFDRARFIEACEGAR